MMSDRPKVDCVLGDEAGGRVLVADSLTYFADSDAGRRDVAVGASFAGIPTASTPLAKGVRGWIAHAAGPGLDDAGISGLAFSERHGIPAAAIGTMTARLSDGHSLLQGTVAHANAPARAAGVAIGQSGREAATLILVNAPAGRPIDADEAFDHSMHDVTPGGVRGPGRILAVWSFGIVDGHHVDDVFCVASHGARVMAEYARSVRPRGAIANDAGFGLDRSGADGLAPLNELGIPAVTVSTDSARIGDALSTWDDGVVSATNERAQQLGIVVGVRASAAAIMMLEAPASDGGKSARYNDENVPETKRGRAPSRLQTLRRLSPGLLSLGLLFGALAWMGFTTYQAWHG